MNTAEKILIQGRASVKYSDDLETRPSRPAHLRQVNARGLLRLLREHNPCSKADLVRFSGLSAPTVSSAIAYLESLNLIENLGEGESNGGRPPGLLRFHASHGYVAGADIGGTRLRMILADLNGRVVTQWSTQFTDKQRTPRGVCTLMHDGLRVMCQEGSTSLKKVLHITAGAPGITNVDAGVVISAPNLKDWDNVPLKSWAFLRSWRMTPIWLRWENTGAVLRRAWRILSSSRWEPASALASFCATGCIVALTGARARLGT